MARFTDYSVATAIPGGAGTVIVPSQFLRGTKVIGFHVILTGAANALGANLGLTRIRALVNGETWHDFGAAALIALTERASAANINLGVTSLDFLIPFFDPFQPTEEEQDTSQMPAGACELQFDFGANSVAGNMIIGITRTTIEPQTGMQIIGRQMNIAASQVNAPYPFSQQGTLRAFCMNRVGLIKMQMFAGGIEIFKATGPSFTPACETFNALQRWSDPHAFVDPICQYVGADYSLPNDGGTYLLMDSAAGWIGVSNQLTLIMSRPLAVAKN